MTKDKHAKFEAAIQRSETINRLNKQIAEETKQLEKYLNEHNNYQKNRLKKHLKELVGN